jgi:cell division septal protein FtsQ
VTERQQNVTPRARKQPPAPKRAPARAKARAAAPARRRSFDFAIAGRVAFVAVLLALPLFGYYAAAESTAFSLDRIEVVGAKRSEPGDIEAAVRLVAGSRLLGTDLDEIRDVVEAQRYVASASVVRVLPDTLRVEVVERQPAVVARLSTGRLSWVDPNGHVLEEFKPENGIIPPPLSGFEDRDRSERAEAENRDRIALYAEVRADLEPGGLWDRLDEVDVKYLNDAKVRLADSGVVVRLGDSDFRDRLTRAIDVLDAARSGDVERLARYRISDIGKLLATPIEQIGQIDVTRSNGSISISFLRSGAGDAGRN